MRDHLLKSMRYGKELDMIYLAKDGSVTKRQIKIIQVGEESFRAYCLLRQSRRTFKIDNVLALVPIVQKESMVI